MNAAAPLPPVLYEEVVRRALAEDLGRAGDLTTDATVPADRSGEGAIVARAEGRVAGLDVALFAFRALDPAASAEVLHPDGTDVEAGEVVARLRARARALLTGERTAFNLLGHLSGIATATRDVVRRLEGLATRVACTRKTTPGLRGLEKYAVRVGGGEPHRYGLDDAVLIKDNHVALAGGIVPAVQRARATSDTWSRSSWRWTPSPSSTRPSASTWTCSFSTTWTSTPSARRCGASAGAP